jgi:cation/acetate symporter
VCAIFVSFTYVAGQMRGVGVVFSRFLEVDITLGVIIGTAIVFFYAVLGGMKGITYTQVAQYCVLIFAFMVPAVFISLMLTDNPDPPGRLRRIAARRERGRRDRAGPEDRPARQARRLNEELGFTAYTAPPEQIIATSGPKGYTDVFAITLALMVGTAGLPHVIIRFYTVPRVRDARMSAFWALLFIALLYTAAPAVGAFGRTNLIEATRDAYYNAESVPVNAGATSDGEAAKVIPDWFRSWEDTGLIAWVDKNQDGRIQYRAGAAFTSATSKPVFAMADDGTARAGRARRAAAGRR